MASAKGNYSLAFCLRFTCGVVSYLPTDQLGHLSTYMDDCFVIGHVDSVLKEEALRRGRYVPGLDPDFIPYWTQNIVCTAVKFLSLSGNPPA